MVKIAKILQSLIGNRNIHEAEVTYTFERQNVLFLYIEASWVFTLRQSLHILHASRSGILDISFRSCSGNATVISLRMRHVRKKFAFLPLFFRHRESTLITPTVILPSVPSSTISMSHVIFGKIPTVARTFFLSSFCRVGMCVPHYALLSYLILITYRVMKNIPFSLIYSPKCVTSLRLSLPVKITAATVTITTTMLGIVQIISSKWFYITEH